MTADTVPPEALKAAGRPVNTEAEAQPATPSPDLPNLPADFWESQPLFRKMRSLAALHRVSPDALLGNYLARTAAMLPPGTRMFSSQMPSGLDLLIAIVGEPGDSKTKAGKLARMSMPKPDIMNCPMYLLDLIDGVGISSGLVSSSTLWAAMRRANACKPEPTAFSTAMKAPF